MEEDGAVKAPLTRLRRRLSVEQGDEAKSPATPSTPTKKRGRLAAKPQLDLIDENTPVSSPKRSTRKSIARDIVEEEKPMTPSRRSTRIKSNTSIISDTVQSVESPRARRATRRNSLLGSDNEAPLTPARQTRRTRKDSASSVENQVDSTASNVKEAKQVTQEIIHEEPEINVRNSIDVAENDSVKNGSPTPRKSPRLLAKKDSRSNSVLSEESNSDKPTRSETNSPANFKMSLSPKDKNNLLGKQPNVYIIPPSDNQKRTDKNKKINKSTSALEDNTSKGTRYRTKSWTLSITPKSDNDSFCSDNETIKKKIKKPGKESNSKDLNNESASGDHLLNKSSNSRRSNVSADDEQTTDSTKRSSLSKNNETRLSVAENKKIDTSIENDAKTSFPNEKVISDTEKLFQSEVLQPLVFIEDSDSNTDSTGKLVIVDKPFDNEDQCVPVVEHSPMAAVKEKSNFIFNKSKEGNLSSCLNISAKNVANNSCEPMDIDETLPDNLEMNVSKDNEVLVLNSSVNASLSKSKRKSLSESLTRDSDKSSNNKSTLIISELKDLSSGAKSPNHEDQPDNIMSSKRKSTISNTSTNIQKNDTMNKSDSANPEENNLSISKNEILSKSLNYTAVSEGKELKSKHNSISTVNNLTGTPLNKKSMHKLGIQTSTPVTSTNSAQKSPKNVSILSQNSDSESSEDDVSQETSKEKNSLIDDEAEEASLNYESGDSQDSEERLYEKENEIVEKGETLNSDDSNVSDDSEYENDSFVVSSNEEDDELLSGSGDDLSMSDNELSMTTKSKQKYNERKIKEQKRASREIFAARHGLDSMSSEKKLNASKSKVNRNRLDSSTLESEDELPKKKNNRLRIDSSKENSILQSDADQSTVTKKAKKLSESEDSKSGTEENEITSVCDEADNVINDPLSVAVKSEPQTPHKAFDISHVNFTVREDVEEVQVAENVTIDQQRDSSDPLGAADEDSSSSDDEEKAQIRKNYDSVLTELNQETKKQASHNLSLNANKKSSKSTNASVLDNLNITQTKTMRYSVSKDVDGVNKSQSKHIQINVEEEGSSNSMDNHLLFLNDSEESEDNNTNKTINEQNKSEELFISLKRTPGKTNIHQSDEKDANESMKKRRKSKSSIATNVEPVEESEGDGNAASFFVDTVGDHDNANKSLDSSLNKSKNKNRKQKTYLSTEPTNLDQAHSDEDAPTETSFKREKNKNRKQKSNCISMDESTNIEANNTPTNKNRKVSQSNASEIIETKTPQSQKKNKQTSLHEVEATETVTNTPQSQKKKKNKSELDTLETNEKDIVSKTPQSQKKKKNKSESDSIETNEVEIVSNTPQSQKKKKNKSESDSLETNEAEIVSNTPQSQKKKENKSESDSLETNEAEIVSNTPQSQKKKKNKSESDSLETNEAEIVSNTPQSQKKKENKSESDSLETNEAEIVSNTPQSQKKKINKSESDSLETNEAEIVSNTPQSQKKKKNKSESDSLETNEAEFVSNTPQSQKKNKAQPNSLEVQEIKTVTNTPQSQKKNKFESDCLDIPEIKIVSNTPQRQKKKKNKSESDSLEIQEIKTIPNTPQRQKKKKISELQDVETDNQENTTTKSKKRKRNHSAMEDKNYDEIFTGAAINNSSISSKKKKLKISSKEENSSSTNSTEVNPSTQTEERVKTNEKKNNLGGTQSTSQESHTKKRKNRDDEGEEKARKIPKELISDKVNVVRLPTTVINQLEDKPKEDLLKLKKSKVVATANFTVEVPRRRTNKPSNYLEESVYLNDDDISPVKKASKGQFKKPKVLPFVPTATLSDKGFTTNFKVSVIPQETKFVAQSSNASNFKHNYMFGKKIKRLGTYEMYKKQRNIKLSKF